VLGGSSVTIQKGSIERQQWWKLDNEGNFDPVLQIKKIKKE